MTHISYHINCFSIKLFISSIVVDIFVCIFLYYIVNSPYRYTTICTLFLSNRLTTQFLYIVIKFICMIMFEEINIIFIKYKSKKYSLCLYQFSGIELNYIIFCCVMYQCKVNDILVNISVNMEFISITRYHD